MKTRQKKIPNANIECKSDFSEFDVGRWMHAVIADSPSARLKSCADSAE
jgi:hypothetical protein